MNSHHDGAHLSRRDFLSHARDLSIVAATPALLPRIAFSRSGGNRRDFLLTVFLRGGMDGLTACVPYGDGDLYNARPTLAIQPPGGGSNAATDLDGFFGLPPAATALLTPWGNGHLAFVHATGSTDPTRSHFEAMTRMEFGIPEQPIGSQSTGWLARHLQTAAPTGSGTLRGMVMDANTSQTFAGAPATLPIANPASFDFPGHPATASARKAAVGGMYDGFGGLLEGAARATLDSIDLMATIDFEGYVPANGAVYPVSTFGTKLRNLSAVLKADIDLEAAEVDIGGWDLHNQLGPLNGEMAALLLDLSTGLEAFYLDNLAAIDGIVVVVMSEFGRRVAENASLGADHGHGNAMLLMGGHIQGGLVHGNWPGLAPGNLVNGDLAITTDYRDVLGEILSVRLGSTSLDVIFPNHAVVHPGVTI